MKDTAIQLTNISKRYSLAHQKPFLIGGLMGRGQSEDFWALKDVNLTIKKGDRIGIIGPNGAGKSTLLKIIAGITQPTTGTVKTHGKVVALLDLESGFHPDLTGEENIFINGMLVGMSRSEIAVKKKQIIKFADIGDFISAPFHTYSSGMKFRLAFAVAMASECEVLIMDEVFVSGDHSFQKKAYHQLDRIQKDLQMTTIISSHMPLVIWGLSEQFFELCKGKIQNQQRSKIWGKMHAEDLEWRTIFNIDKNDYKTK